jgi:DeoR/GlpR family transcriptional regulator of sugar metabolism
MKRNVHIISAQMLLILLKKVIQFGDYESICDTQYEIVQEDYKKIIQLQLAVAEELNQKHSEKFDKKSFVKVCKAKDIDVIVTDSEPSEKWLGFCNENGIDIVF